MTGINRYLARHQAKRWGCIKATKNGVTTPITLGYGTNFLGEPGLFAGKRPANGRTVNGERIECDIVPDTADENVRNARRSPLPDPRRLSTCADAPA